MTVMRHGLRKIGQHGRYLDGILGSARVPWTTGRCRPWGWFSWEGCGKSGFMQFRVWAAWLEMNTGYIGSMRYQACCNGDRSVVENIILLDILILSWQDDFNPRASKTAKRSEQDDDPAPTAAFGYYLTTTAQHRSQAAKETNNK